MNRPDKFRLMEEAKYKAGEEGRRQRMANREEIKVNLISSMKQIYKSREIVKKLPKVGLQPMAALDIPNERTIAKKLLKI